MIDQRIPLFFAVELDTYTPAVSSGSAAPGYGARPHGVPYDSAAPDASTTILASDVGYRTLSTDPSGVQVYPPLVAEAFAINRAMQLDPTGAAVAAAWGSLSLSNASGAFSGAVTASNSDGRGIRIYAGQKTFDATRGIWLDPAYTSLTPLFFGIAAPWFLNTATLDVPLRDATYWTEQPLQSASYGGTGGYDGVSTLLGVPKPKTRGTVLNITPVLIDPVNLIYQYNDGAGTVTALAEGGDNTNILFQSDVADLYTGSTTSGHYRTCNARGMFQLGATPQLQITADVTGNFPVAGFKSTVAAIARFLLTEDMALPAGNLATATFTAVDAAHPYAAGVYFGPSVIDGASAVGQVIGAVGWKLVPLRTGQLALLALQDVSLSAPVAALGVANAVTVTPAALPANVSPPAFRFRVGYGRNWTVMPSGVSAAVTNMTRKNFLANQDSYGAWSSATVLTQYRRPNDPAPIAGALVSQADATAVAGILGALWGTRRSLYAVVVPTVIGIQREIGDVVTLTWPIGDLTHGRVGQIVGEQFQSDAATLTLMVLV